MKLLREPPQNMLKRWFWRRILSPCYSQWVRRAYGVELADSPCWVGAALIRNRGSIQIGTQATLTSSAWANPLGNYRPCTFETAPGAQIRIGRSFSASACCIIALGRVDIGDNVSLGANVTIMDNDMHTAHMQNGMRGGMLECMPRPVVLQDGVWIGAGTFVLKGVSIGARSVVGAGLVLRRSVPADSIVVNDSPKIKSLATAPATGLSNDAL